MKVVYLDTNIILGPIRHADSTYELVNQILEQNHFNFVTGTITLVELASVLAREKKMVNNFFKIILNNNFGTSVDSLNTENQIKLILEYLINLFQIKLLDDNFFEKFVLAKQEINILPQYNFAIYYAQVTQLRTLDQLHFITAYFNLIFNNLQIDYLVTSDINFLNKKEKLQKISKISVISLESFVDLEC